MNKPILHKLKHAMHSISRMRRWLFGNRSSSSKNISVDKSPFLPLSQGGRHRDTHTQVRIVVVFLAVSGVFIFLVVISHLLVQYPLVQRQSLKILDRDGQLIADIRNPDRQTNYQSLDTVPALVLSGLVYREDRRFMSHRGIDMRAIVRAAWSNLTQSGSTQGGSTIDQQVIKLSSEGFSRSWTQKLYELWRAPNLSVHYSKSEILLYYINNLTFGQGVRGWSSACQIFYAQPCERLSRGQLVYLMAKAKFPGRKRLSQYAYGLAQGLGVSGYVLSDFQSLEGELGFDVRTRAPAYANYVADLVSAQTPGVGVDDMTTVQTSFDLGLYDDVQSILSTYRDYLWSQDARDACVIVLQGSKIRTMNLLQPYGRGGSYVNGCLRARQVGSAIKPFFYLYALQRLGRDQDTIIEDSPVEYFLDNGGRYAPKNFDLQYHGKVTIGQALGSSLNIPAVKVLHEIGLDRGYQRLRSIGRAVGTTEDRNDDPNQYGLALSLGVKEMTVLDFALMWTIFQDRGESRFATDRGVADLLAGYDDAVRMVRYILGYNAYRLLSFEQYNRFDLPGTYVKSGTSRHFVDGRVCGGKADYTVCVRVGNYNAKPMRDSGYNTAGVIWSEVMKKL